MKIKPMNAVVLNGKITELTEEQVKSIVEGLSGTVKRAAGSCRELKQVIHLK